MLDIVIWIIVILAALELFVYLLVRYVNKKFQWLIISRDEKPKLSTDGLEKFLIHGYDEELGWIRKPNSTHNETGKYGLTTWTVNSDGCRNNPSFANARSSISCFGDSFTFCRQVNDNETWEHYLSLKLGNDVKNFGVGNYGIDQAFLRLKREFQNKKADIVLMGVVPDTISRILSVWKHYYEYGNTFGFKPRFRLSKDVLVYLPNPINDKSKFTHYESFLTDLQKNDFFYNNKFKKEIIQFPYIITLFRNAKRNLSILFWVIIIEILGKIHKISPKMEWKPKQIIMKINLLWRVKLYQSSDPCVLLKKIITEYANFAKIHNSVPVVVFIPQKDDLIFIKNNFHFYERFLKELNNIEGLCNIDVTQDFLTLSDIDQYFSDNNDYGGHLSKEGNEKLATFLYPKLADLINKINA